MKQHNSERKVIINNVEIYLSEPDVIEGLEWIGNPVYLQQILAAWYVLDPEKDIPMNPQILGKPGVGKTTLAYCAAKKLDLPVYIMQCTIDTRPEDLLITPVIAENNNIKYHASPLVSAMITGGVCILDEANRMAEKSWASLAPLLDRRRYIESIVAGIKIKAHPNFRICVTMNEDSSTFEIPEYIHSRLQPQIYIDFPDRDDEFKILKFNSPLSSDNAIMYVVNFLQRAHGQKKSYSVRDGINILRYYLKLNKMEEFRNKASNKNGSSADSSPDGKKNTLNEMNMIKAIEKVLGHEAVDLLKNDRRFYTDFFSRKHFRDDGPGNPFFRHDMDDDFNASDLLDDRSIMDLDDDFEDEDDDFDDDFDDEDEDEDDDLLNEHFWDGVFTPNKRKMDDKNTKVRPISLDELEGLKKNFKIEIKRIRNELKGEQDKHRSLRIIDDMDSRDKDSLGHDSLSEQDRNKLIDEFIKHIKRDLEKNKRLNGKKSGSDDSLEEND